MERAPKDALFSFAQVLSGSVALLSILSLSASDLFLGELLVHFKVFYLLGALASAGAFALRRKWRWLVPATLLAAVHVPGVFIWYLPAPDLPSRGAETNLRIVTANVLASNTQHELFLDFVRETDPDIIFIQEVSHGWAKSLDVLKEAYSHYAVKPESGTFGIAMFSRIPLDPIEIAYYGDSDLPSVHAELTLNGRRVSVLSYHAWPPVSRKYLEVRDKALNYLAQYADDAGDLVIVAGDLNVTPWSPSYKNMMTKSGLKNARRGYGIKPTWSGIPSPIALLPLDHVLLSPEITVTDFRVGPGINSDHRPLFVELALPPPRRAPRRRPHDQQLLARTHAPPAQTSP